jgi:hypothetical protein
MSELMLNEPKRAGVYLFGDGARSSELQVDSSSSFFFMPLGVGGRACCNCKGFSTCISEVVMEVVMVVRNVCVRVKSLDSVCVFFFFVGSTPRIAW